MHAVSAAELLDLWEWGLSRNPIERGLALLTAAWPEHNMDELASLPIGRRDAWLLRLHETLFGSNLDFQTSCPQCGEPLEMQVQSAGLMASAGAVDGPMPEISRLLEAGGKRLRFRLPNSLDLLEAAADPEPRQALLKRCVTEVETTDEAGTPPLPMTAEIEATLLATMQQLDPLVDASFALTCPNCAHAWTAPFDILGYLWSEIDAWVYRTLREVHWLASAYGWREADILELGAWRRQAYLQMSGYA